MPRAKYARGLTIVHIPCGHKLSASYSVKTATCLECGVPSPASEWSVPDYDNQTLDEVRAYERSEYEKTQEEREEKDRIRKELGESETPDNYRSEGMDKSREDDYDYGETSESGGTHSFKQGAQEDFEGSIGGYNHLPSNKFTGNPDSNILVQVLYNTHELLANQYGKAYSLRSLDDKTQKAFKEVIVEVSEEIGMNVQLSPIQKFGFIYTGILFSMREASKTDNPPDLNENGDEDEISIDDEPINDFEYKGRGVYK